MSAYLLLGNRLSLMFEKFYVFMHIIIKVSFTLSNTFFIFLQ